MSFILVVDDEEDVVDFLTTTLETEGFHVRGATGALEALLQIQKEKPQLLLLDLMMPKVTGEELCRIIKKDPDLFDIHIIILSAKTDTDTKVSCFDSGADDYLTKPISPKELAARLKAFFRLLRGVQSGAGSQAPREIKSAATVDLGAETSAGPRIRPQYGIYRVESLVGSGGMGHVFKAYDEELDRPVAIKVLAPALSSSPRVVERFRREAKILASTDYPGIASIYTFGEEGGDYYFAMQWCSGGSVMDLVQKKQRLPLLSAIGIILQCVDALAAALAAGIVHRDIKPSNLMFDQNQRIKIVDFGLATADRSTSHVTQASELFGTPDYIAPEQAQFGVVDHRADIYSLGISLYYMLYGRLPFTAKSPIDMVVKHATEPFPPYDPLDGAVPRDIYEIIEKMTQKNPEERYQDYASCRRDLLSLREEIYSSTGVTLPRVENEGQAPVWESHDFFEILSTLYISPHSGVLSLTSEREAMRFIVENRYILFHDAPDSTEKIWQILVENQLIKREEVPAPGSDFQECLLRFLMKQSFGFEDLKRVHRQHLKSVLLLAGHRSDIFASFYAGDVFNDDLGGVFIGDLLLELAREIPEDVLRRRFPAGKFFTRATEFDLVLTSLSLSREESFIASRFEGDQRISVDNLCMMTGFSEEQVIRFLFVLMKLGAIRVRLPEKGPRVAKGQGARDELDIEQSRRIAEQFHQLAVQEFGSGNYWKVTELCRQAIRHAPDRANYYHLMAMAYAHHPRFMDDAEQCLLKAIDLDQDEPEYHLSYAKFLSQLGRFPRALEECVRALELRSDYPEAEQLREDLLRDL